ENEWDKTKNREYRTVGSAYVEISFLRHFTFRSTFYADVSEINRRQYYPLYYAYQPRKEGDTLSFVSPKTSVQENDNNWRKFQQDHVLNYKNRFGDHSLTLTGGFTTYYFGNFNRQAIARPFVTGT